MHRILSYQTAMRADSHLDVREFISKRTCVSVILSIAFLTLIGGYLLGKFTSDRYYHIKQLESIDITQINEINLMKTKLIITAQKYLNNNNKTMQSQQNFNIFSEFNRCLDIEEHKFDQPFDVFLQDMLNKHLKKIVECLKEMENNVENRNIL